MRRLLLIFAVSAPFVALGATASDDDIAVHVERRGGTVIVDVAVPVAANIAQVWEVLTDYDHMASFISNLKTSTVRKRQGNYLEVEQRGEARRGPLTFAFETVRAVELIAPREIRSRLLSGDFKSYEFTTSLADRVGSVLITNHGEYVPNRWVPPVIGPALIEAETRKQYAEIRAEILRRTHSTIEVAP